MLLSMVFSREGVFSIKVLVEVSGSPNKVLDLVSRCQSSATECVPGRNSTKEEKLKIVIIMFQLKVFTKLSRFQEYILPVCRIIFMIHLSC